MYQMTTAAPFLEIPQEWHWRPDTGAFHPQFALEDTLAEFRQWILEVRPPAIELTFKNRCDIYKVIPIPDDEAPDFDVREGYLGPLEGGGLLERYLWSLQPGTQERLRAFRESVAAVTDVKIPLLYFFDKSTLDAMLGRIVFPSETTT
jgi:hypothetical protein